MLMKQVQSQPLILTSPSQQQRVRALQSRFESPTMSPGKNPRKLNISSLKNSTKSCLIASPTPSEPKRKVTFALPGSPTKTCDAKSIIRSSVANTKTSYTAVNARITKVQGELAKLRTAAAVRIQAVARGFLQRVRMERQAAALRIQAVARGWWSRLLTAIDLLQLRLKQIEVGRQRDLEAIERRKLHFFEVIRAEVEREQFQALDNGLVDKNQKMIRKLRQDNKKIREKNVKLMEAMNKIDQSNFQLQKEIQKRAEDTKELRMTIFMMEHEAEEWLKVAKKFKVRHDEYVVAVKEANDAIRMETNARRSFKSTLRSIYQQVDIQCKDEALRKEIASVM